VSSEPQSSVAATVSRHARFPVATDSRRYGKPVLVSLWHKPTAVLLFQRYRINYVSQQRHEVTSSKRRLRCRYRLFGNLAFLFFAGTFPLPWMRHSARGFSYCLFPIAYSLLPIPYCLFPIAYSL